MITNDFRGHRVNRFVVTREREWIRVPAGGGPRFGPSTGRSAPSTVKMGPDGALYIADWYNPIIQHGEVDFRDPRGITIRTAASGG